MNKNRVPGRQSMIYLLLVVAAGILVAATVIDATNSFRSLPLYLFLLFTGIGLMLALGTLRGSLAGLVVLSLWIVLKRATGIWETSNVFVSVFELAVVLGVFALSGFYTDRLRAVLDAYEDGIARLEQLNLEDKQIGLIKAAVGKLRLQEEEERSVRYQRPFSLLLVEVNMRADLEGVSLESFLVMRLVANSLKSTTRRTDIPYLVASNQIALILPETDLKGANRVVSNVMQRMASAHLIDDGGKKVELWQLAHLRYGFAAFTGFSQQPINMFEAAARSLQRAQAQEGEEFQNLSVEWESLGTSADEQRLQKSTQDVTVLPNQSISVHVTSVTIGEPPAEKATVDEMESATL